MEFKNLSLPLLLVSIVMLNMALQIQGGHAATCPSTGQLSSTCGRYVVGSNPPVPPSSGTCCSLLKGSSPSCLCSAIPPNAASLISKKGLANVKSSCKLGAISCPGVGK